MQRMFTPAEQTREYDERDREAILQLIKKIVNADSYWHERTLGKRLNKDKLPETIIAIKATLTKYANFGDYALKFCYEAVQEAKHKKLVKLLGGIYHNPDLEEFYNAFILAETYNPNLIDFKQLETVWGKIEAEQVQKLVK